MSAAMHQGPDAALSPETLLEYEPFVRSCVRGLLKGEQEIQDVVQDTWVKALGQRAPVSQPKSWLARVVRNVALDRRRGEGRRKVREEAVARPEESVDTSRARLEAHGNVVKAVLELDEPYRTVVLLSYYQELSPNRIAARMERKPATVRSQLLRAHKMLREKLDQEYGGDRQAWAGLFLPLLVREGASASASAKLGSRGASKLFGIGGAKIAAVVATVALGVVAGPRVLAWLGVVGGGPRQERTFAISGGRSAASVASSSKGAGSAGPAVVEATTTRTQLPSGGNAKVAVSEAASALPEATTGLRIQVVDGRGNPVAGVPVALHFLAKEPEVGGHRSYGDFGFGKTRGPSGSVRLDPKLMSWNEGYDINDYWAKIDGPGIDVRVPFDIHDEDGEVQLELPEETGVIEVTVLDVEGNLLPLEGEIGLEVPGSMRADETDDVWDELENGSARFGFVGLGQSLRVHVRSRKAGLHWQADIEGPRRAGELVQVALHDPGRPRVEALVLDETGEPLRRAPLLFVVLNENRESLQQILAATDGEGRFLAQLVEKIEIGAEVRMSVFRQVPQGQDGRADLQGSWVVRRGLHDLGELRMQSIQSWATGRCVDEEGEPVAGVRLHADNDFWSGDSGGGSDGDGVFRMVGLKGAFSIELSRMDDSGYVLAEPAEFEAGADDLIVRLRKGGEILGAVAQLPRGEMNLDIYFYRAEDMALPKPHSTAYGQLEDDGRFRAHGLTTGEYVLRIYKKGALLFEADHISVREGETTRDARLDGIDLESQLRVVDFEVVPGGRSLYFSPTAVALNDEGRIVGYSNRAEKGRISLEVPTAQAAAILVRASGYRPSLIEAPFDVERVVMRRGISVTLMTHDAPSLEQGDRTAMLTFHRIEENPVFSQRARRVSIPSSIGRNGQATVAFPAPGTYRLHVSRHTPAGRGGMVMASLAEPTTLDVTLEIREEDEGGRIEIALPENLFD